MKSAIDYFIKFPVAVNIVLLAVFVFGIGGLSRLKSSFFPLLDSNIINVTAFYPGASPAEMEEGIVLKIEDNLRGLVGIKRITSRSGENSATVTVEAIENYDIDVVLANVKNAVDRVPSFPSGMEPPVIAKQEARNEAISFTVSGKDVPLKTLKQIARNIEDEIRTTPGISQVTLRGFPTEEIEIAVREVDLRAYDLTFEEVARVVSSSNIITTGGNIKTDTEEYLIRANNRSYYGNELDYLIVRSDARGNVVRLRDVADVNDRWSESPNRIYQNGNVAIQIAVQTTNNEDLIRSSDQVNAYIEKFNSENDTVQIQVTRDAAISLKQRTQLLLENGGLGILLVLILLSVFLKPSLAFWVAFGIPVSFMGMFILSPEFMTINIMSLFGMIIVIGILVDDGIVIGENIYHHYEKGKSPTRAAIDGVSEVIPPIVSAILTTIVAFSAFFFIDGRIGDFFGEVAVVVILTLGFSLIEALIILPAHIAHSKALRKKSKPFRINLWADRFMSGMRDKFYAPTLRFFMSHRSLGFAIPIALLVITIGAISGGMIRVTFFPRIASDRVSINLEMPQGTSVTITDSLLAVIEEATWEVNEDFTERQTGNRQVIDNTIRQIGPGTGSGSLRINLLPGELRDFPSSDIANAIREKVGPIYGTESLVFGANNNFGGSPVAISLQGSNIQELKGAKEALKSAMSDLPQLKDISDSDPAGIKEINLKLRDKAYQLGLNLSGVMSQVRSGFFGRSVQRFQRGRDEIRVWVRYDRTDRRSIKSLDEMLIVTPDRSRVPLAEIASYTIERGEVAINHLEGRREIQVNADLNNPTDSATEILATLRSEAMPAIMAQYPSVTPLYEGQNRSASEVSNSAGTIIPIILFLIFAIIAFTFRSYSQPLLLFIMVPFAIIGVGWGHWLHGFPINMLSGFGIIALIGIVVNDGLVLVGKFNIYLREGMPFDEALFAAAKSRFRAIFLTSLTTIAGLAPLIFETSRQAQFLIPMAISIAYGIFIATFLTLFLLPLLLSVSNNIKVGKKWLITGDKPEKEDVERAIIEQKSTHHHELVEA